MSGLVDTVEVKYFLHREPDMTAEERNTWAYAAVSVLTGFAYLVYVVVQTRHTPVGEFGFQRPILVAIAASIVLSTFTRPPVRAANKDERDREIHRHGEFIGFFVLAVGFLPAFAL